MLMVQAFSEKVGEEDLLVKRIADLIDWNAFDLGYLRESAHQGPRQKLLGWQIIVGLVARCLHVQGGLEQVIRHYFGVSISSSALSQRRQKMQSEPFLMSATVQNWTIETVQSWTVNLEKKSAEDVRPSIGGRMFEDP